MGHYGDGRPGRDRTSDNAIIDRVLCQLSYRPIWKLEIQAGIFPIRRPHRRVQSTCYGQAASAVIEGGGRTLIPGISISAPCGHPSRRVSAVFGQEVFSADHEAASTDEVLDQLA